MKRILSTVALLIALAGLSSSAPHAAGWWQPSVGDTWQWQLTGSINTGIAADIYDVDGFDVSAATVAKVHATGAHVVCYISAGTYENWRPDAKQFPSSVKGRKNGWPGEQWLDIRNIAALAPIMQARMDLCVAKGFDALEPDNIDGYTNSTGFPLKAADQLAYNRWLAGAAHARGLAVALKNDVDQATALQPAFDFAIAEECVKYRECSGYAAFPKAGKPVLAAEYPRRVTAAACPATVPAGFALILKDLDLTAARVVCP